MIKNFIRNNNTLVSIIIFMFIFSLTHLIKPAFLYNNDNSVREFGIGYKNKTIMPIWLFSILLGILSYILVLYYLTYL